MDFKATIDLIIKDLNEASEIIDDLKKYPGVPVLQVEFAKSKCRSAAEVIALLKNLSSIVPPARDIENVKPAAKAPEPETPQAQTIKAPAREKVGQPESIFNRPREKEQKTESKNTEKKSSDTPIIADKFGRTSDLYEQKLGNVVNEKDLSDRLKVRPITNLSDAIGINDKFLFISEIFDGNKDAYSQAISRLDKAESLQDAMAIIMSYTGEKPENDAVIQLLDLVRLKLPSHE